MRECKKKVDKNRKSYYAFREQAEETEVLYSDLRCVYVWVEDDLQ